MKKGFTLIELLAVIVILAIIALIATPIILGIIKNAKEESNERSVDLYVKAAELAVARKNLTSEFKPTECTVEDGECTCDGETLNVEVENGKGINGTITFNDKGIVTDNNLVVGKGGTTPVGEQYLYQWYIGRTVPGPTIGNSINFADYPEENGFLYSTTAPEDKIYYNKFKIENNVVTEGYSCAIFSEKEYCVQGENSSYYGWVSNEDNSTGNVAIIKSIKTSNPSYSCTFTNQIPYHYSTCNDGLVYLRADASGSVLARDGNFCCSIDGTGSSRCSNW